MTTLEARRTAARLLQCSRAYASPTLPQRTVSRLQHRLHPAHAYPARSITPSPPLVHARSLSSTTPVRHAAPKSRDRGPKSSEDTQTDFDALNILSSIPVPTTAVDACTDDGFALNSGLRITGAGVMLVGGEAFAWRPWGAAAAVGENSSPSPSKRLRNAKGQWEVDARAWGALDLVWPKPDLLIVGTGPSTLPLSPDTRRAIVALGVRVEVQDTRNAAAQFNLLATERGVQQVAAALVPIGWREGK